MRDTKRKILEHIGDLKRVTKYHLTNKRNITKKEGGASQLRNVEVHIKNLTAEGYIKKTDQGKIRDGICRTQYYEVTRRGAERLGIPYSVDFPYRFPSVEHQYGLQTAVSAIYLANGGRAITEYSPDKSTFGYRPDCIMKFHDKIYIVEFERSKGMAELVKHVRQREKLVDFSKLPSGSKFIYILNITKSKNKNNLFSKMVDPLYLYDEYNDNEKREDEFVQDFMKEIADLPSWKYRVQALPNFQRFNEGIWFAPGKRETFKIN